MCCGGCYRILALIFLIIAGAALACHFVGPYWLFVVEGTASGTVGLWGTCGTPFKFSQISNVGDQLDGCTWISDNKFALEKAFESWMYACQGLASFGMLLILLAIPTACGSLCCCKSNRLAWFTGVTTIFACLLFTAGIVVWGYFTWEQDNDVIPFVHEGKSHYDWAYYMGIGGVILGYVAGGMFFCGRRDK